MAGRLESGREPVQIVEIDQDFCTRVYGNAPCTAALGVTGTRKCYNTRKTCQDPDNYLAESLTLRFCKRGAAIPDKFPSIPTVQSVSTLPTRLNIGANDRNTGPLGRRGSVTVRFDDAPYSDALTDKYLADRTFDPLEQGTFWSKFLARNPYYQGRELRVIEGYYGLDTSQMAWADTDLVWGSLSMQWGDFAETTIQDARTRAYYIERITGPDARGRVEVLAKDILKAADDRRATAPKVSQGLLTAALTDSDTSTFAVAGGVLSEYSATGGTVRIGDECITYSSASESGGIITFDITARGTDGTEAQDHDEDDQVQECFRVTQLAPYLAIRDLLQDFAGVDPALIDSTAWQAENDTWLLGFELTALITEPTGVNALIGEICEQVGVSVWWDERDQEIRFLAVRPPLGNLPLITGDNILADSLQSTTREDERITQSWIYLGQRDPTESVDERSNYRQIRIRVDADAESADQYGDQRIRRIFARWLQTELQATDISTRILSNYRDVPTILRFDLDAKDSSLWTGDLLDIQFRTVTSDTGAAEPSIYQIISADEYDPGHRVRYEAQIFRSAGLGLRVGRYTGPLDAIPQPPDYAAADQQTRDANGYYANNDGLIPDGLGGFDPGYVYI